MTVVVWLATVAVAALIGLAGIAKFFGQAPWLTRFEAWGLPGWLILPVAVAEVLGAVLLLIPRLATIGGALLASIMLGASLTHLANGEVARVPFTMSLLAVALAVALYRRRFRGPSTAGVKVSPRTTGH